jgi:hypothetical protein
MGGTVGKAKPGVLVGFCIEPDVMGLEGVEMTCPASEGIFAQTFYSVKFRFLFRKSGFTNPKSDLLASILMRRETSRDSLARTV